MAPPQQYQTSETMSLIDEKAKSVPDRAVFYVKVFRKGPNQLVAQQIAAFENAGISHLSDPARWLWLLAGGGDYVLRVAHMDSQHAEIGGPIQIPIPTAPPNGVQPRAVDTSATFREGWPGPPDMVMPPAVRPSANGSVPAAPGGMPPAVARVVYEGTPFAGGMDPSVAAANAAAGYGPMAGAAPAAAASAALASEWARREKEFADREAALRKEIAEKESRLREERLAGQLEAKTRELDAKMAQLVAVANTPREPPSNGLKDLVAALVPLVTQMLHSQHEMRMMMLKQTDAQNAAQIAAAERSHQQMLEFMKAAATPKQTGMSEEMKMLLTILEKDKASNSSDAMAAMTTRMLDAMGMVTKNSISMMEAVSEQFAAPEEHPAVAAIREGVKAIGMMSAGMQKAARASIPQPQPQRMAAGPQGQPVPVVQYVRVPQPQPQQRPPPVATVPDPTRAAPQAQPQPAPVPQAPPPPAPTAFQILVEGVRQRAPIEEVAKYFIAHVMKKDASLYAALDAAEGDPDQVVLNALGPDFVLANKDYLDKLSEEIDLQGDAAGVTEDNLEEEDAPEAEAEVVTSAAVPVASAPQAIVVVPTAPAA